MDKHFEKVLLKSQQGELDAVLMYRELSKVVKTEREKEAVLKLAADEGRHAAFFHGYTKNVLKPKKAKSVLIPCLYKAIGKKRLYALVAKGEEDAAVKYAKLLASLPEIETVMKDESHHAEIARSLVED